MHNVWNIVDLLGQYSYYSSLQESGLLVHNNHSENIFVCIVYSFIWIYCTCLFVYWIEEYLQRRKLYENTIEKKGTEKKNDAESQNNDDVKTP